MFYFLYNGIDTTTGLNKLWCVVIGVSVGLAYDMGEIIRKKHNK